MLGGGQNACQALYRYRPALRHNEPGAPVRTDDRAIAHKQRRSRATYLGTPTTADGRYAGGHAESRYKNGLAQPAKRNRATVVASPSLGDHTSGDLRSETIHRAFACDIQSLELG